jgi:hypothetical protein
MKFSIKDNPLKAPADALERSRAEVEAMSVAQILMNS